MTYTALASLLILGDDLTRVYREGVLLQLKSLQARDGSYWSSSEQAERDMRFVFCAAAISTMLQDWSGVDVNVMVDFILRSQAWDGGFAQAPGLEGHGGSTFCAVAALALANRLDCLPKKRRSELEYWLLQRQGISGFQGRPDKPPDSCYSFWVGGALAILGSYDKCDSDMAARFVLTCQSSYGGFSKWPTSTATPDILHTHYSLAGLSLACEQGSGSGQLREINPLLGITKRATNNIP